MTARMVVIVSAVVGILAACGGSTGALSGADAGPGTGSSGSGADAGTGGSGVQPFKLSGLAVDTKGAPIAGASVKVCNPLYWASCMSGPTGADGRYSFDLPPGNVWEVDTSMQKVFDGRNYCLDLKPDAIAH